MGETHYSEIRDRLYAIANGLSNMGTVHKVFPWLDTLSEQATAYEWEDPLDPTVRYVRFWVLSYLGVDPVGKDSVNDHVSHRFQVQGFHSFSNDADSPALLMALAEALCAALRPAHAMRPTASEGASDAFQFCTISEPKFEEVVRLPVSWENPLVHRVTIEVIVREVAERAA